MDIIGAFCSLFGYSNLVYPVLIHTVYSATIFYNEEAVIRTFTKMAMKFCLKGSILGLRLFVWTEFTDETRVRKVFV